MTLLHLFQITQREYDDWATLFRTASFSPDDRQAKLEAAAESIERDMVQFFVSVFYKGFLIISAQLENYSRAFEAYNCTQGVSICVPNDCPCLEYITYIHLYPLSGSDEVSGQYWQLVTGCI